jgi:hypothetical protein
MSRIAQIHNDYLDPDHYFGKPDDGEAEEAYTKGRQTVLDFFSAETEEMAKHYCYKYTGCGAWLEFHEWGIRLGSIVEGLDFGTLTYPLRYADNFTSQDIQARINDIEREAELLWDWGNVPRDRTGRRNWKGKTDAERGLDAPDYGTMYETDGRSS